MALSLQQLVYMKSILRSSIIAVLIAITTMVAPVFGRTVSIKGNLLKGNIDSTITTVTSNWSFKFELVEATYEKSLQQAVNQTYEQILATKAAAPICAIFPLGDINLLETVTGVSTSSAYNIDKNCKNVTKIPLFHVTLYKAKTRIFFVFTDLENFPLQGWSNNFGHTFIFFKNRKSITGPELTKALAHELSIKVDEKNFLTYYMGIRKFQDSWLYKYIDVSYKPTDNCRAVHAFLSPVIKNHFISERARAFEFKVIKEIYQTDTEDKYEKLSCSSRLLNNLQQLSSIENTFNTFEDKFSYNNALEHFKCLEEPRGERFLNDLQFLNTEKINFYGKETTLCEFFSSPWVNILPDFVNSGPGPRIGGGWKTQSDENTAVNLEKIEGYLQSRQRNDDVKSEIETYLESLTGSTIKDMK